MAAILVLDDDPHILRTLEIMLQTDGYGVVCATSGEQALSIVEKRPVDVALVDLQLPGMSGLDFLRTLRDRYRDVEVIIITAYGSIDTAVDAMKEGAYDYLTKPFSPDQVRHRLNRILQVARMKEEISDLRSRLSGDGGGEFLTRNPLVLNLLEMARTVAATETSVLITGESGTGKNLLARMMHHWSPRRDGPFATVDCASFHETLLESELFGHARGAYTGAVAENSGRIAAAQGGTLFLDEVGEVPLALQSKLLRLVEERVYERLGDPVVRTMNARIIAATNRSLEEMVKEKAFREDLFYRLSVIDLNIPALRHRPQDIIPLARQFMARFNRMHGRKAEEMDPEVERLALEYSWPGNVREMSNVIERAVLIAPGRVLRGEHLPVRMAQRRTAAAESDDLVPLAVLEEHHIRAALALGLSLEDTAQGLGIDPSTLWRKRKKYNI